MPTHLLFFAFSEKSQLRSACFVKLTGNFHSSQTTEIANAEYLGCLRAACFVKFAQYSAYLLHYFDFVICCLLLLFRFCYYDDFVCLLFLLFVVSFFVIVAGYLLI